MVAAKIDPGPVSLRFMAELAFVVLAALALELDVVEELDFAMLSEYEQTHLMHDRRLLTQQPDADHQHAQFPFRTLSSC